VGDVPVLVDLQNIPPHLSGQIRYFEEDTSRRKEHTLHEWQRRYVERFISHFQAAKNEVVVDCGTGSGYMAIELARLGMYVIATDLTLQSLLRLKRIVKDERLEERIFLVCCDAQHLPVRDACAPYFISNAVLEHLPDDRRAVREITRVTKERAWAMVTVPMRYAYLHPLLVPGNYLYDRKIGHLRRYDRRGLTKLFEGWRVTDVCYTGHFKKAIRTVVNAVWPLFDEKAIELDDRLHERRAYGASNLILFFER